MTRKGRIQSGTGVYHVMMRGINHQRIFEDSEDHYTFLQCLRNAQVQYTPEGNRLPNSSHYYAYALMSNHFHLLLHAKEGAARLNSRRLVEKTRWRQAATAADRNRQKHNIKCIKENICALRTLTCPPVRCNKHSMANTRFYNLLTQIGLSDRIFDTRKSFAAQMDSPIDWLSVDEKVSVLSKYGHEFLDMALKQNKRK